VFTVENNTWEKEEDLKNIKEIVLEIEERLNTEVRKQEKLDLVEE